LLVKPEQKGKNLTENNFALKYAYVPVFFKPVAFFEEILNDNVG
jgi:hypothetical protein